jgi:hypothetical protein
VDTAESIPRKQQTLHCLRRTGVTPAGVFTIATPYAWELSNLYITGEVTLTAIPEPTVCILVALALVGVISWPARRGTVSPLVRPNYSG